MQTPITLSKSAVTSSFQDTANKYACKLNLKDSMTNCFIKSLNVIRQHLIMASQCEADDRVLENTTLFQNYRTANSQLRVGTREITDVRKHFTNKADSFRTQCFDLLCQRCRSQTLWAPDVAKSELKIHTFSCHFQSRSFHSLY